MEGFHYPYHPARAAARAGDVGELGEVREVEIHMVMPAPDDGDPRWRLDLAGGGLMDVGCYAVHALRMLASALGGAPRVVGARAGERDPGVDAWLDADLELPGGVQATMRSGMTAPEFDFSYRLVGSRGTAYAPEFARPHLGDTIEVTGPDGTRVEELGRRSSYTYQLEALAAHLRDGTPLLTEANDAVANMELVDEVYRTAGLVPRPRSPSPTDAWVTNAQLAYAGENSRAQTQDSRPPAASLALLHASLALLHASWAFRHGPTAGGWV